MTAGPAPPVRIAMWSGPRNISTALMRAWGSRDDTAVTDEPLYAFYLHRTGKAHPGRDEVLRHHERDWRKVVVALTGPVPQGKPVWYQKHMAHHLLPEVDRDWLRLLRHGFLIREPEGMVASLARHLDEPSLEDTGLPQQVRLFDETAQRLGAAPPVVDAGDLLRRPEAMLRALCRAFGVPFQRAMLSWEPGLRPTDGVWARHWYRDVAASRGFRPPGPARREVPERWRGLVEACRPLYDALHAYRLKPRGSDAGGEV